MREFLTAIFRTGQSSVELINECPFLQTLLNFARQGALATLDISTPSIHEEPSFFNSTGMIEKSIETKALFEVLS